MALTPVSSRSKKSSLNTCLASINDLSKQGYADVFVRSLGRAWIPSRTNYEPFWPYRSLDNAQVRKALVREKPRLKWTVYFDNFGPSTFKLQEFFLFLLAGPSTFIRITVQLYPWPSTLTRNIGHCWPIPSTFMRQIFLKRIFSVKSCQFFAKLSAFW